MNDAISDSIPANLRQLRNDAGLSLSKAAEMTGVSKAMLGQIERGESSPTIATLWKIAQGFHLPLSALIEAPTPADASQGQGFKTVQFPGSIAVKIVFPFDPALGAETFRIHLVPGQCHQSQAHEAGMIEEVFVLEGQMDVLRDGEWVPLQTGEGLRFDADLPHGYRSGDSGAVFLNMHHYRRAIAR
ncbi:HTH-type transcriptional regulator PuuR [Phaeobacter sp. CECT 5382]|uniref:helix-turn-helix domain-containing protein n=1 Tax=Phaeobacter sp. CECT 5382 TaxID=1712645 RepID=UPI0006DB5E39|nr:XRE family transcriptional regulator [Phaeobacter sp. CECT 5382]CUH88270.1 HTH-type transcriptional regulator PuuR [Phaeobacter sp. CECT 5382]